MENRQQHSVGGVLQHLLDANPQIERAFQRLIHGLSQHTQPPSLPEDDPDLADVPPSEQVNNSSTLRQSPEDRETTPVEAVARSVGTLSLASSSPDPDPTPSQDQDQAAPTVSSSSAVPLVPARSRQVSPSDESDGSMPSLQTVSDIDDDVDMYDVQSSAGRSHESQAATSSESQPLRSARRARVDDDVDEGDVRETNRQRMHSPTANEQRAASEPLPPHPGAQHAGHIDHQPPPPYSRLVYTFDFFAGPEFGPGTQAGGAQPPPPPPSPPQGHPEGHPEGHHHHHDGQQHPHPHPMFNFTFEIPLGGVPDTEGAPHGFAHPGFFPFFPFNAPREEQDDPERAGRLIRGLEEVPSGLVQRIERVGGDGGESVCSICWEKLSSDGGGFDAAQSAETGSSGNARAAEATMDTDNPTATDSSTRSSSPDGRSEDSEYKPPSDLPKVVALPCSHVFHTACLLPWFTKPHRTTCPSCRFDIDPDSLTYMPPRQRTARRANSAGDPPAAPAASQPPQPQADTQPAPEAPPAQDQARPARPAVPPLMPFEFSMLFPVMGPPGTGARAHEPAYVPLDPQMTQHLFQRMFGGAQPPAPQPQQPQPQAQAPPQGNPPAPGAERRAPPGYMRLDDQTTRNLFENLFGAHPFPPQPQPAPHAPGAAPAGTTPQHPPAAPTGARAQPRPRPPEKRQWILPMPPGPTLRQRIERQEREMGLRCSDISCGLGPSDDDPTPIIDPSVMRQIAIRPVDNSGEKVCEHTFHPSCLVSAERVAGWGNEDNKEEKEGDEVQVSCPVCRAVGVIPRPDWDEGACALV
ncbi:hypothetical protein IEO21_04114 [Rhodonia placenta]|uniref:RING-type domain-containing protein n=1 Tax=Rhodonia placenta TaxID=104341 RepID=A0A8H7P4H8_9APHY|nr:hypothetical protein IEO21_04114 [Postia placenta]